tara:strand:- start:321 stop:1088 length:768 start_codon:yes stop_codon:yes gene_type:complete
MKITKQKLEQIIQEEKDWMQKAFGKNKGGLHRALGVPEDEDISVTKMADALRAGGKKEKMARAAVNANPDKYGSIKDVGVDKKDESLITKESLQEYIKEILAEVTAGAEKFADFEAIAQAYRDDKTDRKAVQEMVYYVEDVVSPEMENLGLRDTATDSAKRNGLFDWSAPKDEDYKNASIDLYGDGYEVEVYPSSNDDDMQKTTTKTLMDAIKFIRGILSPQGAVAPAPGEDPAQMELPLQENKNRKIKIRRKKK